MFVRNTRIILVCLVFIITSLSQGAAAYSIVQAAAPAQPHDLFAPPSEVPMPVVKAARTKIKKVRRYPSRYWPGPPQRFGPGFLGRYAILPDEGSKRWSMDAEALFARAKGTVRYVRGYNFGFANNQNVDVDLNADLGVPDHQVIGSYSAAYRFKPRWSLRYQIMPFEEQSSGQANRQIVFGDTTTGFFGNQEVRVKWERLYQRIGLVYDPIKTPRARLSIVGNYVRVDDKLSVLQVGCCEDIFDSQLNMGMVAVECERALKTGRFCNSLSLKCAAGVAFGDEAVGADLSTGLQYRIPLNRGRWGYVAGGYRFVTYKKNYNDAKQWDTAIEGGYLKAGFIF